MTGEIGRKHFVIQENSLQEFSCITCCILPSDLTNRFSDKKKKPLTRYLLTHQQLLSCFVSVYYSVLFRLFTIFNTVVIIHIHAEFYRGIWFSVAQEAHSLAVHRSRKHINTADFFYTVSIFCKLYQIPRKRSRLAGDVKHFFTPI